MTALISIEPERSGTCLAHSSASSAPESAADQAFEAAGKKRAAGIEPVSESLEVSTQREPGGA